MKRFFIVSASVFLTAKIAGWTNEITISQTLTNGYAVTSSAGRIHGICGAAAIKNEAKCVGVSYFKTADGFNWIKVNIIPITWGSAYAGGISARNGHIYALCSEELSKIIYVITQAITERVGSLLL